MQHIPPLRGVPPEKILEARQLSDGTWIFKIANKKGPGDFRVSVLDPVTHTRLTPTYAHFAIDLYGKLCQNESLTASLLEIGRGGVQRASSQRDSEKAERHGIISQLG